MKKIIIIFICTINLFADMQDEEIITISDESVNIYLELLSSKKVGNNILLLPNDINQTIFILQKYNKKYEIFNSEKESFSEYPAIDELIELSTSSLKEDKAIKITSVMQLLSILGYQESILSFLKENLDKNSFSAKNRALLLEKIEELLILDNNTLYKLIEVQNKFYAKNVKKYFSIMMKEPIKNIIFTDELYEKFIFYLNKGEKLSFQGIQLHDFTSFNKFIDNELKISDEEIVKIKKALTKDSKETFLYTGYWIRTQVYIRYLARGDSYLTLMEKIKRQKEFFENLKSCYDIYDDDSVKKIEGVI